VFRGAFNQLRGKYGIGCKHCNEIILKLPLLFIKCILIWIFQQIVIVVRSANDESAMSSTAGAIAGPSRRRSDHEEEEEEDIVEDHDSKIAHTNQPALITVFRDPESGDHKVALVVALPGGATHVEFSLLGGNAGSSTAIVTYSWPPIMFNIEAMFAQSIKNGKSRVHPHFNALKEQLKNNRDSIDATPKGVMQIALPIAVQTAQDSFVFQGGKSPDGTLILKAEMSALQNAYTIKQEKKEVKFVDL
jgi:hypothetical protein